MIIYGQSQDASPLKIEMPFWHGSRGTTLQVAVQEIAIDWRLEGPLTPKNPELPVLCVVYKNPVQVQLQHILSAKGVRLVHRPLTQFELFAQIKLQEISSGIKIHYDATTDRISFVVSIHEDRTNLPFSGFMRNWHIIY